MEQYKVMTMNLLTESLYHYGNMKFSNRMKAISYIIDKYQPDMIGVQELTKNMLAQMNDILKDYGIFGDSRHAMIGDEYNSILYRKDKFTLKDGNTYWLSNHPDKVGSKIWNSQFPRIATCVHLVDNHTQKEITMWNTHLDVNFKSVRMQQALILTDLIYRKSMNSSILLTGDFNTSDPSVRNNFQRDHLNDLVPNTLGSTLRGTYGSKKNPLPIDAIYTTGTGYSLDKIIDTYDGIVPSDHYPLLAVLSFD